MSPLMHSVCHAGTSRPLPTLKQFQACSFRTGGVPGPRDTILVRYGEAQAAAASWRAHDGRRQRGTACPHLYRYRLTHTYCSLARLPPTHPFVGAPILQRHFQVQWRARLPPPRVLLPHPCTQDGWFLQPKRRPARFPRRTVPSNCICRCSRMRARLPLPRVLLPHTCTQDGWFLQPKRRPARLPRRTVPSNCICRCSRMRARLPLHILLLHTQVSR
jgi:hypothetical protein